MKNKISLLVLTVVLTTSFFSCYRTLDFDQAENTAKPIIDADLAYFTLDANHLIDPVTNMERVVASDTTRIQILENTDYTNYLIKADFQFKIKNEFQRKFDINIRFEDENHLPTYTITIPTIDEATMVGGNLSPVYRNHTETLELPAEITNFKQSRFVIVDAVLHPDATGVNPIAGSSGSFNFQSAVTLYLDLGI